MPKKAATPTKKTPTKKTPKKEKKGDGKKSLHQEYADLVANVDVNAKKPERKKREVDRFDMEVLSLVPSKTHKETNFEEGTGEKLKEVGPVAKNIRAHDGDDHVIKKVHQLLYNRPGKSNETKKNILRYSGLTAKNKKEGKERFHSKLASWKLNELRAASKLFLLDSKAEKDDLIDALVDYLASPKTPKKLPKTEKTKKKKTITKKKPLKGKKSATTSESEAESSAAESESAVSESEKEEKSTRGRKRKASPSPRGRKKGSASPAKGKSRSASRSPSRTPTKKSPAKKKGSTTPKKGSASPARRGRSASRSRSPSPSPAKKKGSTTPKKGKKDDGKKKGSTTPKKGAASPAKKGANSKKPATKKRKTSK